MTGVVRTAALGSVLLALAGCGGSTVETSYGRNRLRSVNGTETFAGLLRAENHQVRSAVRLTNELRDWAEVIVRFSPLPGPPEKDEAAWYDVWLDTHPGRRLLYVPNDYDATEEYWTRALRGLPGDAPPRLRTRIELARDEAKGWPFHRPVQARNVAAADSWYAVEGSPATISKTLSGPWARGIDPSRASLTRHETLKVKLEEVLLEGDDKPLVISWGHANGSQVLVAASGVFLLNLPLVEPARWPLARRAVDWVGGREDGGPGGPHVPRRVAFVEGGYVLAERSASPSVFSLLYVSPFGRVAAQLFALGLVACLARAPRLGRPRPAEPSGADRPAAHPEALGALLARTGQAREARSILDTYRLWRLGGPASKGKPSAGRGRPAPDPLAD